MPPSDTMIAYKAISLTPELSGTEKRVAGAIIDHFNRKTGRCDPSLDRIARLLGVNRRTVIRAVDHLQKLGIVRKDRHGGHLNRNSYEPIWVRFREIEAEWNVRFRASSNRSKLSPSRCRPRHLDGGHSVPQTCKNRNNLLKETCSGGSTSADVVPPNMSRGRKGPSGQRGSQELVAVFPTAKARRIPPIEAARAAAERRWATALNELLVATPKLYGEVIGAIDPAMQAAATEAELRERGAGLVHILEQLRSRNMRISE
jgi:predicted transcriptional regulator